jgi:hypothetical protein
MKFDVYGRFQLEVQRENDSWVVYRLEPGRRAKLNDLFIPKELATEEIATSLDDIFHELCSPAKASG